MPAPRTSENKMLAEICNWPKERRDAFRMKLAGALFALDRREETAVPKFEPLFVSPVELISHDGRGEPFIPVNSEKEADTSLA